MNMKFRMRVESQKDNWFLSLALLSTNGKHYRYLQSMLNGKNLPVEPIFDGNHKSRLYCYTQKYFHPVCNDPSYNNSCNPTLKKSPHPPDSSNAHCSPDGPR